MNGELVFAIGYGLAMVISGVIAYRYTKKFYDSEAKSIETKKD